MRILGFPGNPVSALVCGYVFLKPLIYAMLGRPTDQRLATAKLGSDLAGNDDRQDFVRARLERIDGEPVAIPFTTQDSSMLATLAAADALIVRPVGAAAARQGERVSVLLLGF
jgi:molybdopterin molybdotransferase